MTVGGRPLTLLPEKAAFLAASRTLLVADAHIGKAVSFRALGVPVPRGTTSETLAALSRAGRRAGARRIVFLGDFLHSARAHAPATLGAVAALARRPAAARAGARARQPRRPRRRPAGAPRHRRRRRAVRCSTGFALCHHPRPVPAPTCSPATCIRASARRPGARPPAPAVLLVRRPVGVLPAFGAFTGMHPIRAGRRRSRVRRARDVQPRRRRAAAVARSPRDRRRRRPGSCAATTARRSARMRREQRLRGARGARRSGMCSARCIASAVAGMS